MTSPQPTDLSPRLDPADALRVLVADLQALADRLGLEEHSTSLQQTIKAAQERVAGPRAVVMLMSEHRDLKRRFLERLLGPSIAMVPEPVSACTRLEYGADAECTVTMPQGLTAVLPLEQLKGFLGRRGMEMPQRAMQAIRLPNPALKQGLAVIDTPVVGNGEPSACILESAEQADAWIFVLNADHELSAASEELLCRLPEQGSRLELVVEGAEALSGTARADARERLMKTLREVCHIAEPRLTLIASSATEGDEGSFWHGRFATFHSIMMLRGRERWLEATRTIVVNALSEVEAEIDSELKSIGLGLRHARLRLGMKDLEGLRTRFNELARLDSEPPRESPPITERKPVRSQSTVQPVTANADPVSAGAVSLGAVSQGAVSQGPPGLPPQLDGAAALETALGGQARAPFTIVPSDETRSTAAREVLPTPASPASPTIPLPAGPLHGSPANGISSATTPEGVKDTAAVASADGTLETGSPEKRGVTANLNERLTHLLRRGNTAAQEAAAVTLPWRIAGAALVLAFVCLIAWALLPRFSPRREPAAQWDYPQQTQPGRVPAAQPPAPAQSNIDMPAPVQAAVAPAPVKAETPSARHASGTRPSAAVRRPLPQPVEAAATQASRAKKRRRHLLGLGKLWHWIRRDHPHPTEP
jgi:hypothetical protein